MAGPTSFAPMIYQAISLIQKNGGYHILVIIADGQVTRSVDIPRNKLSTHEANTINAIRFARYSFLLII